MSLWPCPTNMCPLLSAVGRRRPLPGLGRPAQGHPDALAPHHREALPHPAVRVLQPGHAGGGGGGAAEPGGRELEGKGDSEAPFSSPHVSVSVWLTLRLCGSP